MKFRFLTGDINWQTYGECLDSCWGFYGYDDALSEATDALDACLAEKQETIEVGLTITD